MATQESPVASTPLIPILISGDQIRVNGEQVPIDPNRSPQEVAAHHVAKTIAGALNRPVRAIASDDYGTVRLVIHPDGHTSALSADGPQSAIKATGHLLDFQTTPPPPPPPLLDLEDTHLASALPIVRGITMQFSDGQIHPLSETVLVGRNPEPTVHGIAGSTIKVSDPGRSISRSHLAIGRDETGGVWIVDLSSTNGTVLHPNDGETRQCAPGAAVHFPGAGVIYFGDHHITLRCG